MRVTDLRVGVPQTATPEGRSRFPRLDRVTARARSFAAMHPNVIRSVAAAMAATAVLGTWFIYQVVSGLPGRDDLRSLGETIEGTTVFDAHDRPVFSFPTQYRMEVPIEAISPNLKNAVIAVEDARFYEHDGVDGIRIVGAVLTDIRTRAKTEGASTITQQVARMGFLSRDKTFRRKVREAVLAQRIEKIYSKDEILGFYLNKAYFGDGLYGAEAAARGYFGKPAADLTLAEGALLAGVLKAPSTRNPVANPVQAAERRNVVLKLMLEHELIGKAEYDAGITATVALHDSLRGDVPSGVHFKEQVRRELIDRFGKERLYQGRLKVYTTIDPDMQRSAENAVALSLKEIEAHAARSLRGLRKGATAKPLQERPADRLEAALVALDARTGEVRALVGGRDAQSVGLNRALQTRRQPGSAFKPFVYAAALETGYSPATLIASLNSPIETYRGAWLPEDEHSTADSMTMRTALRTSSNRAAVRMLETVGLERTVYYAKQLGIGTVPNVPSLALGSGEVTLSSMTSAYAAFANGGFVHEPVLVRRVEDHDGTVLFESDSKPRRAVSENTAFLMAAMLADVLDAGTANRARALGFKLPAAGKTGTTNDFVDAWFVGFTPKIVAGVWVGFDQPRTIVKNGFAGLLAVPMWTAFMKEATRNDKPVWFDPPSGVVPVEVCRLSGGLPVAGCRNAASISASGEISYKSMVYTDFFVNGTEPLHSCEMHSQYFSYPYPEPTFAEAAFDDLGEALRSEPELPVPAPAPEQMTPLFAPSSRRLPELPIAPAEPPPETQSAQPPSSALPPAAAPEAPPAMVP